MAWVVAGGLAYYLWVVPAKQRDDEQQRVREQVRGRHRRPVFSASVSEARTVSVQCLRPFQVGGWSTTPGPLGQPAAGKEVGRGGGGSGGVEAAVATNSPTPCCLLLLFCSLLSCCTLLLALRSCSPPDCMSITWHVMHEQITGRRDGTHM